MGYWRFYLRDSHKRYKFGWLIAKILLLESVFETKKKQHKHKTNKRKKLVKHHKTPKKNQQGAVTTYWASLNHTSDNGDINRCKSRKSKWHKYDFLGIRVQYSVANCVFIIVSTYIVSTYILPRAAQFWTKKKHTLLCVPYVFQSYRLGHGLTRLVFL